MRINSINLFNFGSYEGETKFDTEITDPNKNIVIIGGKNGAGKTTLLKIILGILEPENGSVKLFGQDIKHFKEWSKIGYVPQKATNFDVNFPATVKEVVAMARSAKKGLFHKTNKQDNEVIEKSLRQVDMWEYKDRLIGDLSGGQQQRVFIARALAGQPEIIFLDEPTTGVDKKSQDDFYNILRGLNKDLGLTLVLVTHDVERITKEAMHIVCIDHTLVCHTTPEEFLKESKLVIAPHHHNN